jgi:hypothetical protein
MNATATETMAPRMSVAEQARIISGLLEEYVNKLSALNADILDVMDTSRDWPWARHVRRAAWLVDQSELLRKPLSRIISRGSALLEHSRFIPEESREEPGLDTPRAQSFLDSLAEDELALRMREIEIHLHHMLRLTHELRQAIEKDSLKDEVAKLRLAAGLNAMKGGPLNP